MVLVGFPWLGFDCVFLVQWRNNTSTPREKLLYSCMCFRRKVRYQGMLVYCVNHPIILVLPVNNECLTITWAMQKYSCFWRICEVKETHTISAKHEWKWARESRQFAFCFSFSWAPNKSTGKNLQQWVLSCTSKLFVLDIIMSCFSCYPFCVSYISSGAQIVLIWALSEEEALSKQEQSCW